MKTHKDLSWFGQEKALRPAGEESLYYLAPKCLYRGEYRRSKVALLRMSCVVTRVPYPLPDLPFYSSK